MTRRHDLVLLAGRAVLGGYLAAHGAQKLFGAFGGRGLGTTASGFHRIGLRPGHLMATTAGLSELGGGLLTAAGLAHPLGPVALSGTMAVASSTHLANGPFSANRGYELPLTNLAAALLLLASGPGRYSFDALTNWHLPRWLARTTVLGAGVASAVTLTMVLRHTPEPAAPSAPSPTEPSR